MTEQRRPVGARSSRVASALAALSLALLGPLAAAPPASAHATVAASWPANGQVVTAAPDRVVVEFTTGVSPESVVAIVDPAGTSVTVGEPIARGHFLTQRIAPTAVTGTYVAGIHVIGQDLHPIVTRLEFTVDPTAAPTANPAGDEPDVGGPSASSTESASAGDTGHLRTVFPGALVVVLGGLVTLVIRRQSRMQAT